MGIYLNDDELLALSNSSGLAVKAYLRLRSRMDLRTCLVGVSSGISWQALVEWTETTIPRGRGVQVEKPSESAVRRATEALERVGLLQKRPSAVLVFLLPMASVTEVRPNQTRQKTDSGLSTAPDAEGIQRLSGFAGGFDGESGTPSEAEKGPNPTHIGDRRFTSPQSSSTDSTGVNASGDDAAPGGPYRDRPTGSQAGSLGRPGNTQENPDRDRPAASHPALPGRSGSRAQPDCKRLHAGLNEAPAGLAENESTSPECAGDGRVDVLKQVLARRGVRLPAAPKGLEVLSGWVRLGVTPLELDGAVDAALEARRKAESVQPVGVAYVGRIIHSKRGEARRAVEAAQRAVKRGRDQTASERDLDALAKTLGLSPRPGEWPNEWQRRVHETAERVLGKSGGAQA